MAIYSINYKATEKIVTKLEKAQEVYDDIGEDCWTVFKVVAKSIPAYIISTFRMSAFAILLCAIAVCGYYIIKFLFDLIPKIANDLL